MAIVETTSRQFREKQKYFFDLADQGVKIVIERGSKQAYALTPITDDDLHFIPEMVQRIRESQQQIKDGKATTIRNKEELEAFFENL